MYYLIFSDQNIRNRYTENLSQISTRNKFDLKYMRKLFGNRYKLYFEKNKISYSYDDTFIFLREVCAVHGWTFNKCPYILELEDRDAVMAILAHDKLIKNSRRYGIKFHGNIGPFTKEEKDSILSCIHQINQFSNTLDFFVRTTSVSSLKRKDFLKPENVDKANLFSELPEQLLNDISFMNNEISEINNLCIETYERHYNNRKKFIETIDVLKKKSSDIVKSRISVNLKKG